MIMEGVKVGGAESKLSTASPAFAHVQNAGEAEVRASLGSACCSDSAGWVRGQAQCACRSAAERVAGPVPPRIADGVEKLAEELRTNFVRVVGCCTVDLGGLKGC